jgi:hypothetical protein
VVLKESEAESRLPLLSRSGVSRHTRTTPSPMDHAPSARLTRGSSAEAAATVLARL